MYRKKRNEVISLEDKEKEGKERQREVAHGCTLCCRQTERQAGQR